MIGKLFQHSWKVDYMSHVHDGQLFCPRDGQAMQKVQDRGQTIDICPRCGGKWFDHGEFESVVAATVSTPGFNPQHAGGFVQAGHHSQPYVHGRHKPLGFLFSTS